MSPSACLGLALLLLHFQIRDIPAYVRAGDQVEARFRAYHDQLENYYKSLRETIQQVAADLLPSLEGEPPRPVVYGYQILPRLFDGPADTDPHPTETRSYSWPLTEGYVAGENIKLDLARNELHDLASAEVEQRPELQKLARNYRELVANQKTIDQFIEYNRFWQRAVAADRTRFDKLTAIYRLLEQGKPDISEVIVESLGKPDVPSFIHVRRPNAESTVLQLLVYTDIEDDTFLARVKSTIEKFWQAQDGPVKYQVEIELRRVSTRDLYKDAVAPRPGDHLDIRAHTMRFPVDGAVLTTGAETTYAGVGRYVALATADLAERTLAHEFGHLLGFRDGYIRGYQDIGKDGFEIMEMTPNFDDIMSAPSRGRAQAAHFKLILANLPGR